VKRLLYIFLAILAVTPLSIAAPEPAVVAKPGDWTLETRFEHPQQIVLKGTQPQRYWYMILTLTNTTDRDVDFYPKCDLMTDTLQIVPTIKGTSAVLFEKLKNRHQSKYPFLQLIENAPDKLLQGEDNTIDILIIWPDFDPEAKAIDIFISGLSNETTVVDHPVDKDPEGNPVKIYLRKTLQLSYSLAGDPAFRSDQKLTFESKRWVMR